MKIGWMFEIPDMHCRSGRVDQEAKKIIINLHDLITASKL